MSTDNLVYDNHMNLVPDTRDIDGATGMSYVDQSRPVGVMKSETVPDDFRDTLVEPRVFNVQGGDAIDPSTNPMMVDTRIETKDHTVMGSNNQYHRIEEQEAQTQLPTVMHIVDTEDVAALESMISDFQHALEAAGYAVDFHGDTDPNAPVDLTTLLNEVEYTDGLSLRSTQRIETITDLRNEVIELGGITRDQAVAVEALRPQFLTARVGLETYTRFPSKTNYDVTMSAMEDLVAAAAVAGLTITVYAIAKLIKWIIQKIQKLRYDTKYDSVRAQYVNAFNAQKKEIASTQSRFGDVIAQSQEYQRVVHTYANKIGSTVGSTPIETFFVWNNDLYHDLTAGKFNEFVKGMYTGETTKLSTYLTTACNNGLINLDTKFRKLKDLSESNAIVEPSKFVSEWKEVADLATYLIGGTQGTPAQTMQAIRDRIIEMTDAKAGADSPMQYTEAMTNMRYSLDKSFRLDKGNAKRVGNMYSTITRVQQKLKDIQDPSVRKNRSDLYNIFKAELQMFAILINALETCDNTAIAYISNTNQVVKRNGAAWVEAFAAANVHFSYKQ